ncbi:alpha/beta hydrolase [Actinomadura gamaensis]|uniref:Alpha/beta hydrolase n=1 Tax=Actinomadura gamaensis TaxID=1763541 RepID=A0ABV9UE20_9ACTN
MRENTGTRGPQAAEATRGQALGGDPDWAAMSDEELDAFRTKENARRSSPAMRAITGEPHPDAAIAWEQVALPGRDLPVRVYRPSADQGRDLPLVLHVHGGGFVGTAVQCDWINSHMAAGLPAVVVSVEHRLLARDVGLEAAAEDGWDVLDHVVRNPARFGVDPARTVLMGESTGGLISALAAVRAREARIPLRAQVLVNPVTDVTESLFDYPSMTRYADSPTLSLPQMRLFRRLAVPPGADARALSPLHAGDLAGLPPALVLVPTEDPIADQGRRYAERLREAGTAVRAVEYPGTGHAFLSMPGVVPAAETARDDILHFLRDALAD